MEEGLLEAHQFAVGDTEGHFEDIIHFLTTRVAPKGYNVQQKKELVVHVEDFSAITRHLYNMGTNEIL